MEATHFSETVDFQWTAWCCIPEGNHCCENLKTYINLVPSKYNSGVLTTEQFCIIIPHNSGTRFEFRDIIN
jgi:hypothetical protein